MSALPLLAHHLLSPGMRSQLHKYNPVRKKEHAGLLERQGPHQFPSPKQVHLLLRSTSAFRRGDTQMIMRREHEDRGV